MTSLTALQSALVFVRPSLLKLLDCAARGSGPLAAPAQAESECSTSVHVQRKLHAGDLIGAASSAKASDDFRDALEDVLSGVFSELREALLEELRGVLLGETLLSVPIDRARAQHLPRVVITRGVLAPQFTREVAVAAPADAALLAQWTMAQDRPERSTAHGFVQYAANNSAFMNRLALFGVRVRIGEDHEGRPLYDYDQAISAALDAPLDGASGTGMTLAETLSAPASTLDTDGALEHALHSGCREVLGHVPGRAFTDLFSHLCAEPDTLLRTSTDLHLTLAARHSVHVEDVRALAQALDHTRSTMGAASPTGEGFMDRT